ncbi:MAG: hypothetical protein Q4Q03_00095 [Bowdeniella nasicola]|nr:hypothetical protein [Bowdeniella nasicola]
MIDITDEFATALDLAARGEHLVILGDPHTGKSTFIEHLAKVTRKNVLVTAPTPLSANRRGYYCLTQFFDFSAPTTQPNTAAFADILPHLDMLIIGWANLLRADQLDLIAARLREVGKDPDAPFGGVQIVLVADLHAPPPAVESDEADTFHARYQQPYFTAAEVFGAADFHAVGLTRVFARNDSSTRVKLRRALATGHYTHHVLAHLNRKMERNIDCPRSYKAASVWATPKRAQQFRERILASCEERVQTSAAHGRGDTDPFCSPIPDPLLFAAGVSVMIVHSNRKGFPYSGFVCQIDHSSHTTDETGRQAHVVAIAFDRLSNQPLHPAALNVTRPRVGERGIEHEKIGHYVQLPFVLSEGLSLQDATELFDVSTVFDFSGAPRYPGQLTGALTNRLTWRYDSAFTEPITWEQARAEGELSALTHTLLTGEAQRLCAIECLTAPTPSGAIPVEIALAFPDGTRISTLIAPSADQLDGAPAVGISTERMQLAPTLTQAWAMVMQEASGYALISSDVAAVHCAMRDLDPALCPTTIAEVAVATDVHAVAADRAAASLNAAEHREIATEIFRVDGGHHCGYTLNRDGEIMVYGLAKDVSQLLTERLGDERPNDESDLSLLAFEETYDVRVTRQLPVAFPPIAEVLRPGTHVCFFQPKFQFSKSSFSSTLQAMATSHYLWPIVGDPDALSEILIADGASRGWREAKARCNWDKPVYDEREFVQWVEQQEQNSRTETPGDEEQARPARDELAKRRYLAARPAIADVLVRGTDVTVERSPRFDEIYNRARERGFRVTASALRLKTRAVIADYQSSELCVIRARREGIPIYSASEFFAWYESTQ